MAGPDTSTTAAKIDKTQRGLNGNKTTQQERGLPDPTAKVGTATTATGTVVTATVGTATVGTATAAKQAKAAVWEPVYHPGVNHDHQPARQWKKIQDHPDTFDSFLVEQCCRNREPVDVAGWAATYLWRQPLAVAHVNHYLKGKGKDFDEDANLERMLQSDERVRRTLADYIRRMKPQTGRPVGGSLTLSQGDYALEEFESSFGTIDVLDLEVNFDAGTVRVWFQDRYEWHPFYPDIYPKLEGDTLRSETNCVHAAMVELKDSGAADFWMKGKATVPLKDILAAGQAPGSDRTW